MFINLVSAILDEKKRKLDNEVQKTYYSQSLDGFLRRGYFQNQNQWRESRQRLFDIVMAEVLVE